MRATLPCPCLSTLRLEAATSVDVLLFPSQNPRRLGRRVQQIRLSLTQVCSPSIPATAFEGLLVRWWMVYVCTHREAGPQCPHCTFVQSGLGRPASSGCQLIINSSSSAMPSSFAHAYSFPSFLSLHHHLFDTLETASPSRSSHTFNLLLLESSSLLSRRTATTYILLVQSPSIRTTAHWRHLSPALLAKVHPRSFFKVIPDHDILP
ncbi:hypothetical protein CBOM_07860 [Ceraceosorus bombacis]|uniref:Uncharacterized protein n=1 Tax=Ceraceosorus bombacis TaxID=401625 RepID=A0A0P1BPI7_9BASI|nr:hypothetical protein CBOM_07860 [Ceraceosorus bombacis]